MTKQQIARRLSTIPERKFRVRTVDGWGTWVWEYKVRGDNGKPGWLSVCTAEDAQEYFGWGNKN